MCKSIVCEKYMVSGGGAPLGFRGEAFAFDSPAAAVVGMLVRVGLNTANRDVVNRSIEACPIETASGRILAETVVADRNSPSFDAAAMDGFAARVAEVVAAFGAAEGSEHITLRVLSEARIGSEPPVMPCGEGVVRIATGAAIPLGADVVIKREDVVEHADGVKRTGIVTCVAAVSISRATAAKLRAGENIRRCGENARAGTVMVDRGKILSAAALGTLATIGAARPRVFARLRVAIITTGDEIVSPESTPGAFQIRNSNAPMLHAILTAQPWAELSYVKHVRDDGASLAGALREAIDDVEAVVLSGGVSMGHRDPVRAVIVGGGGRIVFHGLPQRPGKPMLGAIMTRSDGMRVPVFGLPGNPISAMVTCTRIVVPVLAQLAGATRWPTAPRVRLVDTDGRRLNLWWHRLVRIDDDGAAKLIQTHGSGDIVSGGRADGFIEVPPGDMTSELYDAMSPALYSFYPWPA